MGIIEKIKDIEAEIARTQKNKATEHHLGMLKAKLAKYHILNEIEDEYLYLYLYLYFFDIIQVQITAIGTSW